MTAKMGKMRLSARSASVRQMRLDVSTGRPASPPRWPAMASTTAKVSGRKGGLGARCFAAAISPVQTTVQALFYRFSESALPLSENEEERKRGKEIAVGTAS